MSKPYGPYNATTTPALTAGTVIGVPVDQAAAAIRISNQTLTYDLLVSFAPSQPPAVTSVGGTGPWAAVLHPGDRPCFTLQNADKTPTVMGQFWQGTVWLLPLNTSGQLAQAGTVPSLANVWLTTYAAGEPIPPADPAPLAVASTQQQRAISVPLVPDVFSSSFSGSALAPNAVIDIVNVGFTPTGDTGVASWVHAMLYAITCYPFANNTYETVLALGVYVTDNNGVNISPGGAGSIAILHVGSFGYDTTAKIGHGLQWSSDKPLTAKMAISPLNSPTPFTMHFALKNVGGTSIPGMAWNFIGGVVPFYGYKNLVPPILGGWTGASAVAGGAIY